MAWSSFGRGDNKYILVFALVVRESSDCSAGALCGILLQKADFMERRGGEIV